MGTTTMTSCLLVACTCSSLSCKIPLLTLQSSSKGLDRVQALLLLSLLQKLLLSGLAGNDLVHIPDARVTVVAFKALQLVA